jgi:hypothetical protein
MRAKTRRPVGAATIAILAIIVALAEIIGGGILIFDGAVASAFSFGKTDMLVAASIPVGFLALTLAILGIVFAVGMLRLKPWTWSLGVGVYVANVALSIILGITGAIISIGTPTIVIVLVFVLCCAIILYYLLTPNVHLALGKATGTNIQMPLPLENQESGHAIEKIDLAGAALKEGD